ncbi:MAG: glycosyltransferase family 2 protein [OCS116 cluster bacterium]|nr:glycosyltransferase family 2 protein [OCS116 cluster bacterium]
MNDLVSIITPSYNCQKFVADTIDSVLAQAYENWEMIIVDDASTDDSIAVIEKYAEQDGRIKLIKLAKNGGAAMARNKALEHATGRYIAFLDSDDIWHKDKLALQIEFMSAHNRPISFTAYELMDADGMLKNHIMPVVSSLTLVQFLKNTIIGFSTTIIDRDLVGHEFKFADLRACQDTNLLIDLLKSGHKAYGLDKVLMQYRLLNNSISANKIKAAKSVWNVYYNVQDLGFLPSAYYFAFYAFNAIKKRL